MHKIKPQILFKEWYYYQEAIDQGTEKAVVSFLKNKTPEQKEKAEEELAKLREKPIVIPTDQVFKALQDKLGIVKQVKQIDPDAQRKHFEENVPGTTEDELKTYDHYKSEDLKSLQEMMKLLRKFLDKELITLKFENDKPVIVRKTTQGEQRLETPNFTIFMSKLHDIKGNLENYKGTSGQFNPSEEENKYQKNLVATGDNIWVYKGDAPDICRIFGKGQRWCISSSSSAAHWFSYRIKHHQTQYFVFDFNKNNHARYVNPGVAPEGKYSEWVDARNTHDTDPEDPHSQVGIEGYDSINEYKNYLASKGIPKDIWVTTEPEEWEKRLNNYNRQGNFKGAKSDYDSRVFPMYLKIVGRIGDDDFETLTAEEKKQFVMGKDPYERSDDDYYDEPDLSDQQLQYVSNNIEREYYNSLDLSGKIHFAVRTNDQNLIYKIAQNHNLDGDNVYDLLYYANNKDEIAELLGKDNFNKLSDNNVQRLINYAKNKDKDKMAELILNKKPELSDDNVKHLLYYAIDKDKIAKLIINKKPELSGDNVYDLLYYANNKDEIAELLGKDNFNKLSDDNVKQLIYYADVGVLSGKIAELIINNKPELSGDNVYNLINYAINKDKIAELIINKIPELSVEQVIMLIYYANNKDKIAELLGKDNFNKLSDEDVEWLISNAKDEYKIAEILNQYLPDKTPEMLRLINTYLE